MKSGYKRLLKPPDMSFFLFGARGTGKSTWLKETFPEAVRLDLLDTSLQLELIAAPDRLEALVGKQPPETWIVLDEVQKVPAILDEVHRLMEERAWRFALCGSSARKLKRGGADLLAGRALTLHMEPFSFQEVGTNYDLDYVIQWGLLPVVWAHPGHAADILAAYLDTYLREEIREEGAVRKYPPFIRFLAVAGQMNGQVLNAQNIAREAAVPRSSVDGYFGLLQDTLVACLLPAYRPGVKVREAAHPKFYWTDTGMARAAAGLLRDPLERIWEGTALETLIYHELRVYNSISGKHRPLAYYQTPGGAEIDFVIETRRRQANTPPELVCLEVKRSPRWNRKWERPMRDLYGRENISVRKMIGIYTGEKTYHFDGIDIWPVEEFLAQLYAGNVF